HSTRKRRWNEAMRVLQLGAEEFNASQVGKTYRVLVVNPAEGRTYMDSIVIDGMVFIDPTLPVGEFADVTIADWRGYDLVAERGLQDRGGVQNDFRARVPKMAQ
ncbi:MAG TPA: 30S ribosomal protein S12 methylthiotransferase RimO, partial [Verrucomicrobium sp.]|nr:30S ribosomal protein S12 methylthiotransferase RimO [Verrucomicrobium sp.]